MMKTLDELKEIDAGEFCPSCGHAYIDHSVEVGCVNCACESNHPKDARLALSDAIQQIEALKQGIFQIRKLVRYDGDLVEIFAIADVLLKEKEPE